MKDKVYINNQSGELVGENYPNATAYIRYDIHSKAITERDHP